MESEKIKNDKSWLKMFLYGSKDYKTKQVRQSEKIKDVLTVKLWLP